MRIIVVISSSRKPEKKLFSLSISHSFTNIEKKKKNESDLFSPIYVYC